MDFCLELMGFGTFVRKVDANEIKFSVWIIFYRWFDGMTSEERIYF